MKLTGRRAPDMAAAVLQSQREGGYNVLKAFRKY